MVKVALIEDEKNIRESLSMYLDMHNEIDFLFAASSAEEGLAKLEIEALQPSVLILDIGLPGMTGIDALSNIKSLLPQLDVIMFSSYGEEEKIFGSLCAGACSYISKGTDLNVIAESIFTVSKGGSFMSPSIARKIATHFIPNKSIDLNFTERQIEILDLLVKGMSYKMIAAELIISIDTVRFHIKKIYKVLQVNNGQEAVAKYLKK